MNDKILTFPNNFLWGAATASYQIEGGYDEDGKGRSIWDTFTHIDGKVTDGTNGDIACDHYHRFESDVELMAELGLKAYRFSISWPRILPNGTGEVNQKGIDFYNKLIDKLLEKNIIPFITLYHWDLPQALEDKGGWRVKETAYAFGEYAKILAENFSDRVTNWITLNELWCSVFLGYEMGYHAPGCKESRKTVNQIYHNFMLGHGLAVQSIRKYAKKTPEIGIAHFTRDKIPFTDSKEDYEAAKKAWHAQNCWLYDPIYKGEYPRDMWEMFGNDVPDITDEEMKIISSPLDFAGFNIYQGEYIKAPEKGDSAEFVVVPYPADKPRTTMGWPIDATAIYYGIKIPCEVHNIPKCYITENGAAFVDVMTEDKKIHDQNRIDYLHAHLKQAHHAISDGFNLCGYFLWTLMDNFEWSMGYTQKFGIVHTNLKTMERTKKDSAFWYQETIKNNALK